jgi:hypothetical protein
MHQKKRLISSFFILGGQISPGKSLITKTNRDSLSNFHCNVEQTSDIVKTALELGINHFDVAESHAGKKKYIYTSRQTPAYSTI